MSHSNPAHRPAGPGIAKRPVVFTKIFRWQAENPTGPQPISVAVTGSFNGWQKTPLRFDKVNGIWQLTLENIPGNCTHNYMLLVNGKPASDKNSDGLAIPQTAEEKANALETPRGPRVFMLFSQMK